MTSGSPLSAFPALDGRALKDLESLAAEGQQRELRRGEILVRQGESSDALYFVLSGRFTVHLEGVAEPTAEIGQGQPIGEIGFFAGLPRTATVTALRDSSVLTITREHFQKISQSSPEVRDSVVASFARRLSESVNAAVRAPGIVHTVAVLPAGGSRASRRFVDLLREVFGSATRAVFLTEMEIAARVAGASLDDPATSRWLNSLETETDFIFYIADQTLTQWTLKSGPNVVVILGVDGLTTYTVDYDSIPGPGELVAAMLNPFSRRRLPQVPSILQVIMLSMLANRRPDLQLSDSDILIKPELPDDLRFTSWERHNEIFLHAYRGVASWIQTRLAEDGSKALAMITAARSSTATGAGFRRSRIGGRYEPE